MQPRILAIVGPTASGKTSLALSVAKKCHAEIVSADSRQIYKYLDIGTAKPTLEERSKVTHHFVDHINPDEHFDAGLFGQEGRIIIKNILKTGKTPVIAGGSGLYIRSLVDGLFEGPKQDETIRLQLSSRIETEGITSLLDELQY